MAYISKGKEEGSEEGSEEGAILTLSSLVAEGILTKEEAAKRAGLTISEFEAEIKRLS